MATPPKPTLLCEDETVCSGCDAETGAPVVLPKTSEGRADESMVPTDARENARPA